MAEKATKGNRVHTISVSLTKEEYDALLEYADKQIRHHTDQASMLLRKALIDCGALKLPEHRTGRD